MSQDSGRRHSHTAPAGSTEAREALRQDRHSNAPQSGPAPKRSAGSPAIRAASRFEAAGAIEPLNSFPKAVNWNNPRVTAILEAAVECFSQNGFSATTLAQIGSRLGQRKSIVHYYFASKAALVEEVQSYVYARYLQTLRSSLQDGATVPAENPAEEPISLGAALSNFWRRLEKQPTTRWLNVEFSGEGRHDRELESRERILKDQAHDLLRARLEQSSSSHLAQHSSEYADLSQAVLDGLALLAEREAGSDRADKALQCYVQLLESSS